MASFPFYFLFISIFISQTLAQSPEAPAPPPGPINLTDVFVRGGQYNTFIRLLNESRLIVQLENQLNNTPQGLTILAPTDNAFLNLKAGALNDLNDQEKSQFLLYHVIPQFHTLVELLTISNPVRTEAGDWGLNFTGQGSNQVNVSTGVNTVQINNKLREISPLSIFQLDQALLPQALFGNNTSAPPPKAQTPGKEKPPVDGDGDSGAPPKPNAASPPSNDKASGVKNGIGMGIVLSFGLIAISVVY